VLSQKENEKDLSPWKRRQVFFLSEGFAAQIGQDP
jgi:hypothetical protein